MIKYWKLGLISVIVIMLGLFMTGCVEESSDSIQQERQEIILKEAVNAVGISSIKNFREFKILKDIQELCDQEGLLTYTYVYSEVTGKYTFIGESIGYGIPYATQLTNPMKLEVRKVEGYGHIEGVIPQADPNGLYKPSSADGTWVLLRTPSGKVEPQYIEPKISVFTYKLPERLLNN